jgi:hypothetical protein
LQLLFFLSGNFFLFFTLLGADFMPIKEALLSRRFVHFLPLAFLLAIPLRNQSTIKV